MTETVRQMRKISDFRYLSSKVFELENSYRIILKYLVYKENPEKGAIVQEIAEYSQQSDTPLEWHVIKKKLTGTKQTLGLIPLEYVYEKYEGRGRGNKQNNTYHLTFKGLLAALSTGVQLDKIYLYKNYINFLNKIIDNVKIMNVIKQYFKSEIHVFLLLNYLQGLKLQSLTNTHQYFKSFLDQEVSHSSSFGIYVANENIRDKIRLIITDYFSSKIVLRLMGENEIIPALHPFWRKQEFLEKFDQQLSKPNLYDSLKARLDALIYDWPDLMERIYRDKDYPDLLRYTDGYRYSLEINTQINVKDLKNRIRKIINYLQTNITLPKKSLNREVNYGF